MWSEVTERMHGWERFVCEQIIVSKISLPPNDGECVRLKMWRVKEGGVVKLQESEPPDTLKPTSFPREE